MKRCKTCRYFGEEREGFERKCFNPALNQSTEDAPTNFRPPSQEFGCSEHWDLRGTKKDDE